MADWRPIIKCRDSGFPRIMGVINVTPDSFFEKSRASNLDEILERAIFMSENGADWIDIGGESTRPGATEVTLKEELDRVSKAIEIIRDELPNIGISVDTRKSEVAMSALKHGANINSQSDNGTTALMAAIDGKAEIECIEFLIGDENSIVSLCNIQGASALSFAAKRG